MPASIAPAPLPGDVSSDALLRTLLDVSLTGVILFRPIYDATGDALLDFAYDYLNPAAQQMLRLPAQPAESFLTRFPMAEPVGIFAFYCEAFLSWQPRRQKFNFQYDSLDGYFHLAAQRQGPLLVVSFTDTNDQPRSAVEDALRASQAREQEALAEAERQQALFYQVLEQAPAMICVLQGPEHVFEFANARYRALVGERPLVGLRFAEALPELAGQGILEPLNQVYRTGESFYASEQLVRLDYDNTNPAELEKRYYNLVWQARRDLAGTINGVLVFAFDVSPQILARQQVQQLNQELAATQTAAEHERNLLQALLEQAPVAIALFQGLDVRIASANERMAALWGRTPEQLFRRTLLEAMPELTGQGFDEMIRQVQITRVPYVGTEEPATILQAGQLAVHYYTFSCQPVYDAEGELLGVLNVAVEVTEQVEARRALEQLNQELEARVQERTQAAQQAQAEAERQRLSLVELVRQVPAAMCVVGGPDFTYEAFNPLYAEMFGNRPQVGRPLGEVLPEVVNHPGFLAFRAVYEQGQTFRQSDVLVPLARSSDGVLEDHYFSYTQQPRYNSQGQINGVFVFAVEVTDQVHARQQVQTLNEELRATNEAMQLTNRRLTRTNEDLDTFVYTASHDLKAPITNIEGLLGALRYQLPGEVQAEEVTSQLLEMMQGAVERFRYTIDQLTDISRLQQAQDQPAEQVRLAPVVADVQLDLKPLLVSTNAQLTVEVGPDVAVLTSPKNLRSVVANLLSNAVKYHHPGRLPRVQLRATAAGGQVVLTVSDNGLGLTAQQQSRLFGLFQRLHTHVEGTGVGLYMVKRIIDNAGGSITVESEVGVGTTFIVSLPVAGA